MTESASDGRGYETKRPDADETRRQKSFDRLINFSDGVFAFAITLLVLDLVTPAIVGEPSDATLSAALVNELHAFLGYLVSFWVIGVCWMSHHRVFSYIKSSDSGLMRLDLVLLFFVVLIPFATRVLNYGFLRIALDVFALIMIGATLMTSVIWRYAANPQRQLLYEDVSQRTKEWLSNRGFVGAFVYLVSMFFAFVNPYITLALWLLQLPILIVLDNRLLKEHPDRSKLSNPKNFDV